MDKGKGKKTRWSNDDYPKCPVVVAEPKNKGLDWCECGNDGVNAVKMDDDTIAYRCREHTDPRMNVVVGPGPARVSD